MRKTLDITKQSKRLKKNVSHSVGPMFRLSHFFQKKGMCFQPVGCESFLPSVLSDTSAPGDSVQIFIFVPMAALGARSSLTLCFSLSGE